MSVTPLEICLLHGMFSSGSIPMGYARSQSRFGHLLVNFDSYVLYYSEQ